jgi:primase-polymerase (primpol)-like protein
MLHDQEYTNSCRIVTYMQPIIPSTSHFIFELASYQQWVVTNVADKIPLDPRTLQHASVDNPGTWADLATAQACCQARPNLTLGFVLTANDPYSVVDLDSYKATNPAILDTHKQL